MKVPFSRDAILALDPEEFSSAEKKQLLARFFPTLPAPEWKMKLRKDWSNIRRWAAFEGIEPLGEIGFPYRYTSQHIRHMAKLRPPQWRGNRVTDFTSWIYSLYLMRADPKALSTGKTVERQVAARLSSVPESMDWDLIYEDPLDQPPRALRISQLLVEGKPLWGAPDIVFRNKSNGTITIVERKASNREIPTDGWPNLRAQLWAYAHIDDWVSTGNINLIGEIWGFQGNKVYLRKILRWDSSDESFNTPNAELFKLYSETKQIPLGIQ